MAKTVSKRRKKNVISSWLVAVKRTADMEAETVLEQLPSGKFTDATSSRMPPLIHLSHCLSKNIFMTIVIKKMTTGLLIKNPSYHNLTIHKNH